LTIRRIRGVKESIYSFFNPCHQLCPVEELEIHLYGLLLVPYAIPKGARPIWVGSHTDNILGEENDDGIVILEYPNHDTLLDIFTSKYYESINGLREKWVRRSMKSKILLPNQ